VRRERVVLHRAARFRVPPQIGLEALVTSFPSVTIVDMNDTISIRGIVATELRHLVTGTGVTITSFRLASTSRRWDRATGGWVNGHTNWYTVTSFRALAGNVHRSVKKGDRVIVTGRLRVRSWERDERSGISVEVDADAVGHDLAFGQSTWMRSLRTTADEHAGPDASPTTEERAAAAHVVNATETTPVGPLESDAAAEGPTLDEVERLAGVDHLAGSGLLSGHDDDAPRADPTTGELLAS
jgi:single-strand DNA-binding protein